MFKNSLGVLYVKRNISYLNYILQYHRFKSIFFIFLCSFFNICPPTHLFAASRVASNICSPVHLFVANRVASNICKQKNPKRFSYYYIYFTSLLLLISTTFFAKYILYSSNLEFTYFNIINFSKAKQNTQSAYKANCVSFLTWSGRRDSNPRQLPWQGSALPLSHSRIWCLGAESNHRHGDFQSPALPTELSGHLAERVGFEPTVPLSITGFQDQLLKPLGHLSRLMVTHRRFELRTP